jgi:predicted pyridoxine 5'-phosphate oxidase superfamily flavin-nucleotide-binding protein
MAAARQIEEVPMTVGFHDGELAVQRRAGVRDEAARLVGMLAPGELSAGVTRFLSERDLAMLAARDHEGQLWISPLVGSPGFLDGRGSTLRIHGRPASVDPLQNLPANQFVGLLAIELATRRRVRINGTLSSSDREYLEMSVEQAYGNCPQYIQQRSLHRVAPSTTATAIRMTALGPDQARLIARADTFFLGTTHPERGTDASHRGGSPGFVRVDGDHVWWPDYPGNNMFNSLGNLAIDDTAALLFIDFMTGQTLHLSGAARLEWSTPGSAGDDGGTGRRVVFSPAAIVAATGLPIRSGELTAYSRNPPLR